MKVEYEPVTAAIGSIVTGFDLAAGVDREFGSLQRALHERGVLFFAGQRLDDERHLAVGRAFGPLYRHSLLHSDAEITVLDSEGAEHAADKSTGWHTDAPFEERPPYVAVLRAVLVPACGGDTIWTSMTAAYESLSSSVQRLVDELQAVHDPSKIALRHGLTPPRSRTGTHPVVIVDPLTAKRSLYVNENYTSHIVGMSAAESDRLLDLLFSHAMCPDFQVRFRWQPNAVAMWNERLTQHYGVRDCTTRRVMHRVIAVDEPPRGIAAFADGVWKGHAASA